MSQVAGKVAQVIGPVVDVAFASGDNLPKIYDSLEGSLGGNTLVLEVEYESGEKMVRNISMDSTDGLRRAVAGCASVTPIQMPSGEAVYGRLFNVISESIDGMENMPKTAKDGMSIHREAPKFENLSTSTQFLFTGIQV